MDPTGNNYVDSCWQSHGVSRPGETNVSCDGPMVYKLLPITRWWFQIFFDFHPYLGK